MFLDIWLAFLRFAYCSIFLTGALFCYCDAPYHAIVSIGRVCLYLYCLLFVIDTDDNLVASLDKNKIMVYSEHGCNIHRDNVNEYNLDATFIIQITHATGTEKSDDYD